MRRMQVGDRFGRLTVLELIPGRAAGEGHKKVNATARCLCDCGQEAIIQRGNLRSGHIRSCGCLRREAGEKKNLRHGDARVGAMAPEYRAWINAKNRTTNPRATRYDQWGGRGIRMCDEWLDSYESFLANIGRRPSPQHSLDRIDVDRDYEPGNVRWATPAEQRRNRRDVQGLAAA